MNRGRGGGNTSDEDGDRPRKRARRNDSDGGDVPDRQDDERVGAHIDAQILRIGEKTPANLETALDTLVSALESDLATFKNRIIKIICQCVTQFPDKTTVYSTLVGLMNAKEYSFGGDLVENLVRCFKDSLKAQKWEDARITLRFFADLVNCHVISASSLMALFEQMIDSIMEDNIPQARSDYFVFCVLTALPYFGRELFEKKEQDLEQLLNAIDSYLNKRSKVHHTALRVWYSDTPHPQEEYLECLWAQISKLRADKWVELHIHRPYLAFDSVLCEALQHNLPSIQMPPHEPSIIYPQPKVIYRLFDYTDCPDGPVLPGAHSIERFLIEEQLLSIIDRNCDDRKECAILLVGYPQRSKIPLDYMIVEVIFSQIFALPRSPKPEICYGSLLLELCKLSPQSFPQVLAQAVELLYERLDCMNVACVDRFASWFAYHLSNFQFKWSWEEWSNCLNMDPLHPKPKFIRETLVRCMRLSYHQRVLDIIPDSFKSLAPEEPRPYNKYSAESTLPGTTDAHLLMAEIKAKKTPEQILSILQNIANPLKQEDDSMTEPDHNPLRIDIFLTVLLNAASKSFTHLFAALTKFQPVLRELNTSREAQVCILKTMHEVWRRHQQLMVVLVEKLLKAKIIECTAVANWIFSKDVAPEFTRSYIWEILHATIKRQVNTVKQIKKEITDAREAQAKAKSGEDDSFGSFDAPKEPPTDEMIERMEERLESAQSDLKNLFLIIFQRFIMVLSEHIQSCEASGKSFKNHWFRWTIGRLQQVFFEHHEHVFSYLSTWESLLFTSDVDQHILLIFKQFRSLRQ